MKLLETGNHIIYSTCTFSPLENEEVIKSMLDNDLGLSLKIEDLPKYSMSEGLMQDEVEDLKYTRRLYPFEIRGEGHYLAKLVCVGDKRAQADQNDHEKSDEESFERNYIEIYKNGRFEKEYFNEPPVEFQEFCKGLLKEPIRGVFRQHGEKLMLEPSYIPDLRGLRVLRRGWYLGDVKKGRFEPSNHFAMGLSFEQIKDPISFSMEDIRVNKYLKCETIEAPSTDGWKIVCLDRYPLGFVKAKNGVLKNKYPSSWRML